MSTPVKVEATFWAAVVPTFGHVWRNGQGEHGVQKLQVKRIWQSKPEKSQIQAGTVVVKLTVRFNETAFMPLAPAAVIDIPDSMVAMTQVVDVEAFDDNGLAVAEHLAQYAKAGQP